MSPYNCQTKREIHTNNVLKIKIKASNAGKTFHILEQLQVFRQTTIIIWDAFSLNGGNTVSVNFSYKFCMSDTSMPYKQRNIACSNQYSALYVTPFFLIHLCKYILHRFDDIIIKRDCILAYNIQILFFEPIWNRRFCNKCNTVYWKFYGLSKEEIVKYDNTCSRFLSYHSAFNISAEDSKPSTPLGLDVLLTNTSNLSLFLETYFDSHGAQAVIFIIRAAHVAIYYFIEMSLFRTNQTILSIIRSFFLLTWNLKKILNPFSASCIVLTGLCENPVEYFV